MRHVLCVVVAAVMGAWLGGAPMAGAQATPSATQAATRPAGGEPVCGKDPLAAAELHGGPGGGTLERQPDGSVRLTIQREQDKPWNVTMSMKSDAPVAEGDVVFVQLDLRTLATTAEAGEGRVGISFETAGQPFATSLYADFSAGKEWATFMAATKVKRVYPAGRAQLVLHLAFAAQTLEVRNVEVLNFKKAHDLKAFPFTRFSYAGREADAPWRKAAAERIEKLRKGDLTVEVVDAAGKPVAGAAVRVRMTRHAFGFGSAVVAAGITGTTPDDAKYRAFIAENFSRVVFENDLKWPMWAVEANRARTLKALAWLEEKGIEVRGHCLVWPSFRHAPADVAALKADPAALKARIRERVSSAAAAVKGRIVEWDVVNELYNNHEMSDIVGKGEVAEWFRLARAADPKPVLFINDYAILSGMGLDKKHQDAYFKTIADLKAAGAPVGGIGMQSHFGATPTPPERMLKILDRFATLGLPIESTEFDIRTRDEQLQADFTRDFLTTMFSHPAVNGVVMWGFWEKRHWIPEAALLRADWTPKPNAAAWLDLVRKAWWTDVTVTTDAAGRATVRGFCGTYEITTGAATAKVTLPRAGAQLRLPLP